MWTLIKSLLLKWALLKWLLKSLGSLGILVPIAFVLKMVGLPVLMVLAVLALPILLMAEQALAAGQGIEAAVAALQAEITPIDDVRSTAEYRRAVAGNLLRQCWMQASG